MPLFRYCSRTNVDIILQDETIRLRIQHDVLNMVFDGRSIFPPMGALRRVLDCGFGTGLWAFQVAWENPRCEACIA